MSCVGVGAAAVVWYKYSHQSQVYWWFQPALRRERSQWHELIDGQSSSLGQSGT